MTLPVLVIDANIVISALFKDSFTRKFLLKARKPRLFAPDFIMEELSKYLPEFSERMKVGESELRATLEQLFLASELKVVSKQEYSRFMETAAEISPDIKDVQYFALALKIGCPVWSQDSDFKRQFVVKVYSTKELFQKLS